LIKERNNMAMMHHEYSSRQEYSGSLLKDTSRSSFETPNRSVDSMQNKLDD
jgi:hypothetical protein